MALKKYLYSVAKSWNSYKYRFVPWIVFNLKNRQLRNVEKGKTDEIVDPQVIFHQMCILIESLSSSISYVPNPTYEFRKKQHHDALKKMEEIFGFYVIRDKSTIEGTGVFVRRSKNHSEKKSAGACVKRGQLIALYPGTLYEQHHAIFFQSIANSFIFKCANNTLIDGCDRGLSKIIFRSCMGRDRCGYYPFADDTWLTEFPVNPLNVGQYVNNQSKEFPSNVVYQEFSYDQSIGYEYRRFIPYVLYGNSISENQTIPFTFVCLISSRDIHEGEEIFSDYFTMIS